MNAAGRVNATITLFYCGVPVPQLCTAKSGSVILRFRDKFAAGLFISKMREQLQPSKLNLKENCVRISPFFTDSTEQTVDKIIELLQSFFEHRLRVKHEMTIAMEAIDQQAPDNNQ